MNTDDADPGNPSSPDEPWDGGQAPNLPPRRPEAHEVELDSYGVPVQDRPAKGRSYLLAAGCLIIGGASASLAVMDIRAKLPSYLVTLAVLLGILAFGPPVLLFWDNKRNIRLGRVFWVMIWAGLIFALLGLFGLTANHCDNSCGA